MPDATSCTAAVHGHPEAVQLLLEQCRRPKEMLVTPATMSRHCTWRRSRGSKSCVLCSMPADVHGHVDLYETDVIGWATAIQSLTGFVRHTWHWFERSWKRNPEALDRRLSRFELGRIALHYAMSRNWYDIMDLLIDWARTGG
jgi:hypothetical protein